MNFSQIHVKIRNVSTTRHASKATTTKDIVYVPNVKMNLWNIFVPVMKRLIPMNAQQERQPV
jgi:hypothetical protein